MPAQVTRERHDSVAAAFRTGVQSYASFGAPLYSALCAGGAECPEVIALATRAQAGAQPVFHLLTAVHFLVLGNPGDPLARFFATLNDPPLPPQEAWPDFQRFCREREDEILDTLASTTVQTTFADRCATIVPPLALVADWIGEPLHLLEIGCSAGVLLALDRHAYRFKGHERFGRADAALVLDGDYIGTPPMRVPRIASRTGLDLHPLDVRSERDRRWLIAQTFPEYRKQREQLALALAAVAETDIRMHRGDALETLPQVLAGIPDPVCIFHSVCLSYWSEEARAALDAMLTKIGETRPLYRVGNEPSNRYSAWSKGHDRRQQDKPPPSGEITITRYAGGEMDSRIVGETNFHEPIRWLGWDGG